MSDNRTAHSKRSSGHRKHSKSNKVLRTVTYVLTPFLIFIVVSAVLVLSLFKPYSKISPYLGVVFNQNSTQTQGEKQISIYHPDDAPTITKDIVDPSENTEKDDSPKTHKLIIPYYGDYYGTFTCENANMIDIPIYAGTRNDVLEKGIGWFNGSDFIGRVGKVVLAGHNHTYFLLLPLCNIGDTVVIDTACCKLTYIIKDKVTYHKKDLSYINPSKEDMLVAYTCWNNGMLGLSDYRIAIICDLVKREWKDVEVQQ